MALRFLVMIIDDETELKLALPASYSVAAAFCGQGRGRGVDQASHWPQSRWQGRRIRGICLKEAGGLLPFSVVCFLGSHI
jgi:hypothetical protein